MTTNNDKFKDFLRKEFKENPELVIRARNMVQQAKSKNNAVELSEETLTFVMRTNQITKEQAKDLWSKSMSFNQILMKKYDDKYLDNVNEVCRLTKEYQQKLLATYKK